MCYFVYLLISKDKNKTISYVGYTNNLSKRILLHNNNKGAKFTRGRKWTIIYKKKYEKGCLSCKPILILSTNLIK